MKNWQTFNLGLLFSIAFLLSSCSDDDGPAYLTIPEGSVALICDGEDWESTIVTGLSISEINNFNALNGVMSQVSLTFEGNAEGTYTLGGESLNSITFSDNNTGSSYTTFEEANASGEIVVSEFNFSQQTISGSFNAVVVDSDGNSKEITNGLFNKIPYN